VATAGTIVNLGGNDRFPASTPGWENLPNLAPVFTSSPLASVQENALSVVTVAASDPDGDPLGYSISGGADAALFSIDATTGALSFVAAPNFEAPSDAGGDNVYDVMVSASDGTIAPAQAIAVTVTNVDEAPVFFSPSTVSVAEGAPANTVVLTTMAIDPEGSAVFYSISGVDAAFFTLDSFTGQLRLKTPPDFETKSVYNLQVRAHAGASFAALSVTVFVTDVEGS